MDCLRQSCLSHSPYYVIIGANGCAFISLEIFYGRIVCVGHIKKKNKIEFGMTNPFPFLFVFHFNTPDYRLVIFIHISFQLSVTLLLLDWLAKMKDHEDHLHILIVLYFSMFPL